MEGDSGAGPAQEEPRPIRAGMKCNITHEIYIDGQLAFRMGESVFVDDIVPNEANPTYKYVVMSKELTFRKFQLSDMDLIPAEQPLEYKPKKPARVWPFIKRHKIMLPCVVVGATVIIVGVILFASYGFKWKPQFLQESGDIFTGLSVGGGNAMALGNDNASRYLYNKSSSGWITVHKSELPLTDIATADNSHTWVTGRNGTIYFWDGVNLTKQFDTAGLYALARDSDVLSAVSATDKDHAWAVGTFLGNSEDYQTTQGVVYSYDGQSWKLLVALGAHTQLVAVAGVDSSHVWAASKYGDIFFYDGANWVLQSRTQVPITSICATDKDHAWAVSAGNDKLSGRVLSFKNGQWGQAMEANMVSFMDVSATSPTNVWAVGTDIENLNAMGKSNDQPKYLAMTKTKAIWRYEAGEWKNIEGPPGSERVPAVAAEGTGSAWVCSGPRIFYGAKGI